ncbi:hypothetical protein HQ550_02040 [bacterium]|nr:hypothetical protein [bacterium]
MKKIFWALFLSLLLSGCALFKIPEQTIKTVGTAIETTGKVAEAAGKTVVAAGQAIGKIAEAGGKTAEAIAQTPGAKEAIANQVIP